MTSIQTRLETELSSILARHAKIDAHLHNRDREIPKDWDDAAAMMENDEVLEALDDQSRARIAALRAAMRRLEDGVYGVCANCGSDIGDKRLQALPATPVCVDCAT
jgi:DnaK suppressor protein